MKIRLTLPRVNKRGEGGLLHLPGEESGIHVLASYRAKPINICFVWFVVLMVFNATFNNISVISWWSVLLVE